MISGLSRLLGLSFLFCLGLPFALFALATTTLAIGTLLLRLVFVYFDLFLALLNGAIASPTQSPPRTHAPHKHHRRKRSTPPTPSTPGMRKVPSFASLVGSGTDRDYEGVGGWRFTESADEEAVWMGMNRNLELPASPAVARKHHRRSLTGGQASPLLSRSMPRTSGSASPEGYFNIKIEGG